MMMPCRRPQAEACAASGDFTSLLNYKQMTLEELEREYVSLRQQADAVRSYL
jgi:hypothetical protein